MTKRPDFTFAPPAEGAKVFWRSLEEKENPSLVAERAKDEPGVRAPTKEEAAGVSRRGFLTIAGAGATLLGMEACIRRPVENIVPYVQAPEYLNPGTPLHYASVIDRQGDAVGVLVSCSEGRPTKVEGNPEHPASQGMTDLLTQASVLDLYDPDRAVRPTKHGHLREMRDFDSLMQTIVDTHDADSGAGLRVLAQPTTSPSFRRLRVAVKQRFPNARFHTWSAVNDDNSREGTRIAFGRPLYVRPDYRAARVILSLDCDFLGTEPGNIRATRGFSDGRRLASPSDEMSRLYVVESAHTLTGANADHRLALAPSRLEAYLRALAAHLIREQRLDLGELAGALNGASSAGFPTKWIAEVAADLGAARERAAIVVGSRAPARVHALAHALNGALGSLGTTVVLYPTADEEQGDQLADLKALTDDLAVNGRVKTLLILGGNPVLDAPADLAFADKLRGAELSVHFSATRDETGHATTWHVPRAHELETWGDQRGMDGTLAIQQPLIAPMYGGRSDIEVLAHLAGSRAWRGHFVVRETMRGVGSTGPSAIFDNEWRRLLHRGVVPGTAAPPVVQQPDRPAIVRALAVAPAGSREGLEAVFVACPKLLDGRHANNQWLLEMPDPMTRIVWDNAALVSPKTARDLHLVADGSRGGHVDMIRVARGDAHVDMAVWALPGVADGVVVLPVGWGRTKAGRYSRRESGPLAGEFERIGTGGFDVYPLRASDALHYATGVQVTKAGGTYLIVQTQEHDSMEGRPIALDADLAAYRADPSFAARRSPTPRALPLWREVEYRGHKWGLTIDLHQCTGCNTCVLACQAENNIPTVGKQMVRRGREMHWIRIDRYFGGQDGSEPDAVAFQPLACQQCEEAPCENVCPVNATAHSPEGLNDMSYNRCIGTRYCANNCPYKVRRFNYLNWHIWKEDSGEVPETLQMQFNPNVTVRTRGVMEKCTYCVQRIEGARIATRIAGRDLRDGDINTACAQACPAGAIVFGDLNDAGSRVSRSVATDRRYKLLGEVGTQPRTTYLAKIRNPNPRMSA